MLAEMECLGLLPFWLDTQIVVMPARISLTTSESVLTKPAHSDVMSTSNDGQTPEMNSENGITQAVASS